MLNEAFKIGVLAFQGGFAAHMAHLKNLGIKACEVKTKEALFQCDGLILPGGESTTMNYHLKRGNMQESLLEFALQKPIFGTCAGLIIMAQQGILPITIERNAYGRQSASFITSLPIQFSDDSKECEALFIRAPQILSIKDPKVTLLASFNKQPVFVQHEYHLGATFHPELTSDLSCHQYFIDLCKRRKKIMAKAV